MKKVMLCLMSLSWLASAYAEPLVDNPNLPHPAAAVKAYENNQKIQRNDEVAKAGVAKGATQLRPVHGPINRVGTPRLR